MVTYHGRSTNGDAGQQPPGVEDVKVGHFLHRATDEEEHGHGCDGLFAAEEICEGGAQKRSSRTTSRHCMLSGLLSIIFLERPLTHCGDISL